MAEEKLEILVQLKDLASGSFRTLGNAVQGFERTAVNAFKGILGNVLSLKGALGGLGVALGVREIAKFVLDTANAARNIGDLSVQTGLSTRFLSEMELAFREAGLSIEDMETGINKAVKAFAFFAQTGGGELAPALHILGLEFENLVRRGTSLEELFPKISEGLKSVSAADRELATIKIFGRGGAPFVRVLSQDFAELRKRAGELGGSLSKEDTEAARKFTVSVVELEFAFQGLSRAILLPLFPELAKGMRELTDLLIKNRPEVIDFFASFLVGSAKLVQGLGNLEIQLDRTFKFISRPGEAITQTNALFDAILFRTGQTLTHNKEELDRLAKAEVEATKTGLASVDEVENGLKRRAAAVKAFTDAAVKSAEAGAAILREHAQLGADLQNQRVLTIITPEEAAAAKALADRIQKENELRGEQSLRFSAEQVAALDRIDKLEKEQSAVRGLKDAFGELTVSAQAWGTAAHDAAISVAHAIADDTGNAIVDVLTHTKDLATAFREAARSILVDIARIIVKMLILKLVETGLGILGSALHPALTSGQASINFGGVPAEPQAVGGILRRPTLVLAGEAGTEAFVPMHGDRIPIRGNRVLLPGGRSIKTVPMARGGTMGGAELLGDGGAGTIINVNVHNSFTTSAQEAQLLERNANKLAEIIARKQNSSLKFREAMSA